MFSLIQIVSIMVLTQDQTEEVIPDLFFKVRTVKYIFSYSHIHRLYQPI